MQKIIALPASSEVLEYFGAEADFKNDIPYLPDDILLAGSWEYDTSVRFRLLYRKVVPAILFFLDNKILCIRQPNRQYRVWFGDVVGQEDPIQYSSLQSLAGRTLKKERVRQDTPYDFIGYCTARQDRKQTEFLIVYAAKIYKKQLLKDEWLADLNVIPRFYFKLEPLSRKLFNVFYETPELYRRYLSV